MRETYCNKKYLSILPLILPFGFFFFFLHLLSSSITFPPFIDPVLGSVTHTRVPASSHMFHTTSWKPGALLLSLVYLRTFPATGLVMQKEHSAASAAAPKTHKHTRRNRLQNSALAFGEVCDPCTSSPDSQCVAQQGVFVW